MPSAKLRQLREDRANIWSQYQDITDRSARTGEDVTTEDGSTRSALLDQIEALSAEIETEERAERLGGLFDRPAPDTRTSPRPEDGPQDPTQRGAGDPVEEYRQAFGTYLRRGLGKMTPDQQAIMERGFSESPELRALGEGTGAAGGYTVPVEFQARMVETMKAFGGIMSVAGVINTADGHSLQWATNNDTANIGALLSENSQVAEQDLTFGTATLGAYMYTSKAVRVSFQLLQDAAFNFDAWLPRKLGERIGRATAVHFATGTGVGQPQGLITGLTNTQTAAGATAITYADLVALEFRLDPAYRNSPNLTYVFADTALRNLRMAVDATGRPLWAPAVSDTVGDTINGHRYVVDNNMATLATGSRSVVFGDVRAAYVIRAVAGAQTLRLTERWADYLQVGFLGFARFDALVQDNNAAAVLVQA
jgi:HK97 family phage major capsid protein